MGREGVDRPPGPLPRTAAFKEARQLGARLLAEVAAGLPCRTTATF
jgi:hypothetical protein